MDFTAALAREFEQETQRIDQLVWDAMALRRGESVLFCGVANDVAWIRRATQVGVTVTVLANDEPEGGALDDLPVAVVRGSATMLPMPSDAFDATIAFHYLHEVDPFFHANIVAELGRVGKRCIIVEPAPPSDPLGQRIAQLYSRAKRGLGQFENYHPVDYWRKLLAIVKPQINPQTFAFTRTPPRDAVREIVSLVIATMAAEDTPEAYVNELRALARRPDAKLVPQARVVVVGLAAGCTPSIGAGTPFHEPEPAVPARPAAAPAPSASPQPLPAAPRQTTAGRNEPPRIAAPREAALPVLAAASAREELPAAGHVARNAFGLGADAGAPVTAIPSVAGDEDGAFGMAAQPAPAGAGPGWEWEAPER